ncbi:copper homeostasis CutC domain-containing protein [Penicillium hispanicum]|uniref:copper homeostasis CutC domain-containing protein n=1 Tax=Penicillium hispanicum TaxID=1080232 RepID=UPI0025422731|nr:copper homeostasis CutC domain-containing protein [Penicillium hispanicum]KAJ5584782.1 copper homeostasis CutC domain-containing protein [Penicillium hispanicum]
MSVPIPCGIGIGGAAVADEASAEHGDAVRDVYLGQPERTREITTTNISYSATKMPHERDKPLLEIACFNEESAISAAEAGANRIELCHDYASGGLSPDPAVLSALKSRLSIPICVMIRPHAKHFYYNNLDFEAMRTTLGALDSCGADGFVFGILNQAVHDGSAPAPWIDVKRNKELVGLARGKPCTFHRAFDCIPEPHWDTALSDIAECGFTSILTSGGPSGDQAIDCVDKLAALFQKSLPFLRPCIGEYQRVPEVIIGGGVRSSNVQLLWERTHAQSFHSSALLPSSQFGKQRASQAILNTLLSSYTTEPGGRFI